MKPKRKVIILLAAFMLMGALLTGCRNGDSGNSQAETNQPVLSPQERRNIPGQQAPADPNSIPPNLRHPDGTVG